ncbi:hypothetical protein PFNF135_05597 [Plasmodium falciparum NF135/5.C10]|uniref:Uncharacterized protein n=1 Tax=Plasmodium falciparum NF135/5.C10 TaxID=1036726 RepID=W4I842_PLAFA|nr:hypothetical protein PFNF135_05597 [Plasmodium falciparum NF135/5.C10]
MNLFYHVKILRITKLAILFYKSFFIFINYFSILVYFQIDKCNMLKKKNHIIHMDKLINTEKKELVMEAIFG